MAIITRAAKGSALSHAELDNNFTELYTAPYGRLFPSTKGVGIKLDSTDPQFGWHDMLASTFIDPNSVTPPLFTAWRGGISAYQFPENSEMLARWHMPHDYAPATDMYIHVHWTLNSALVTGGTITWGWEVTYAKGHDQAAFPATKLVTVSQAASLTPYQHMIAETALSTTGGSATQLDTTDLETDGLIMCRFYIDSNDLTVSSGLKPDPFIHFVDIHYQSTNLPTKNRAPSFWTV